MRWLPTHVALVTISIVLLAAIRIDGHQGRAGPGDESARAWKQPQQIANQYPEPISRSRWQLDFEGAEDLLLRLRFTSNDEIVLDEATVVLMQRLYDWQRAPENRDVDLGRVRFLISRFFPDTMCHDSFSDLFDRFTAYKDAQDRLPRSRNVNDPSVLGSLRDEDPTRLQMQFFSDREIEGLFGRRNRLARYLTSRRRIIADETLSDAQRRQAIEDLGFHGEMDPDEVHRNGPCQ